MIILCFTTGRTVSGGGQMTPPAGAAPIYNIRLYERNVLCLSLDVSAFKLFYPCKRHLLEFLFVCVVSLPLQESFDFCHVHERFNEGF